MAVKEEKYDPGYEAAYGGAYTENPCNSDPCSFSSNGLSMFLRTCLFFSLPLFLSCSRTLAGEGQKEKENESQAGSIPSAEPTPGLDLTTLGS